MCNGKNTANALSTCGRWETIVAVASVLAGVTQAVVILWSCKGQKEFILGLTCVCVRGGGGREGGQNTSVQTTTASNTFGAKFPDPAVITCAEARPLLISCQCDM